MGFMDKAKKMAEQAQAKLDEVQKEFNSGQGSGQGQSGPAVEYDKHGRPIPQPESGGPHGDPIGAAAMGSAPPPPPPAPPTSAAPPPPPPPPAPPTAAAPPPPPPAPATASAPPLPPAPPAPAAPPAPPSGLSEPQDRNKIDYTPPPLSSGDPLAG